MLVKRLKVAPSRILGVSNGVETGEVQLIDDDHGCVEYRARVFQNISPILFVV